MTTIYESFQKIRTIPRALAENIYSIVTDLSNLESGYSGVMHDFLEYPTYADQSLFEMLADMGRDQTFKAHE